MKRIIVLSLAVLMALSDLYAQSEATLRYIPVGVNDPAPIMYTSKTPYSKYPSINNTPYSVMDSYCYNREVIEDIIKRVADYQLTKYGKNIPKRDWLVGTFYSSFVAAYSVTGEQWFLDKALAWSKDSGWDVNMILNADDLCPAQTYLDIYFIKGDQSMYETINSRLSGYFDRQEILPGEKDTYTKVPKPFTGRNLWSWCDALYMAPPVYARMGEATGDSRYYEMLHRLYWDSVDFLYSDEERLFFRNSKAETEKLQTPNGKKVFWSRGNGWVIAGLARVLEYLPKGDPMRDRYLKLFQDLSYGIAKYQMEDGLWRSSLNDPEWYPLKETSGSGFFVYAFAKGVNEGWLPKEYFMPIVLKGWSGLLSCVTPEGKLGYSQIVAGSPHEVRPSDNKDYAAGAFILAASEMLKMNPAEELKRIESRKFIPHLVARDGAWTWYNDERVIFNNNIFYASYVKRNGDVALTTFSIENWVSCHAQKELILSTWRESDDHNAATLLPLKNGNILAAYTTHGKTKTAFMREIKTPRWTECELLEERRYSFESGQRGLTYQNLHRLSSENDRIFNFTRGVNYNPTMTISDDEGRSWSEPIWIIQSGSHSSKRPYTKYISNGKDRIDFVFTDGHPRDVKDNSVYHIYYSKGNFYRSNGQLIRTLEEVKKSPITAEESTMIFDGSTKSCRGWTHDTEYNSKGEIYCAFISSPSGDIGTDMRYWISTFNGKRWVTEEIAYAGSNLYSAEQHYAGGIALMPDGEGVVLSANVDPKSGEPLPNGKWQLFKGVKNGKGWSYTQLTFDPVYDHLRPVIVRGENRALFWFTGNYPSFMDYNTDIMMSYEF
ncbi:MAG: glycoside hydrolase family 88 protein [Rikenellaceae bacterium]